MQKYRKIMSAAVTGGICFSWLGVLELVDFGNIFTTFLATLFSVIVSVFFGTEL
ncbi:MAG: hypothetical protein JXO22_03645 [Phycisphaerae bacterium]|nr:hypothetical protein [Phycisphaerae bacterium]